jgi:hypothetical protein
MLFARQYHTGVIAPKGKAVRDALTAAAYGYGRLQDQVASDLMWVGVSFLLRPAKYLHTRYDTHTVAFRMADIQFRVGGLATPSRDLRPVDLCTHVGFHSTTQKNGISGEIIWLCLLQQKQKTQNNLHTSYARLVPVDY